MATKPASEPAEEPTNNETAVAPESTSANTTAEQPVVEPVADEPADATPAAEPAVVAPADAPVTPATKAAAEPVATEQPSVVFVTAPQPPKKRGARGVGALVVVLSTLLFAAVYAVLVFIIALVGSSNGLVQAVQFLSSVNYYVPVIVFFFAHLLLVIIVNRGGWWAHVLGGFFVALVVWVGFVGAALISAGAVGAASSVVSAIVLQQLTNPLGFAAAIAAREVPIWVGGMVSKRGRTARARNVEAQAAYERELAEHRATVSSAPSTSTRTAV